MRAMLRPNPGRSDRWSMAAIGAALLLMLTCGGGQRAIVVALRNEPSTLDPHTHGELQAWSLLSNFYDGLVRFSPATEVEPCLAASWEAVDERTTRFHLRSGVRFHDGSPFGAEDVVASFRRAARHPASGLRGYLVGIKDIRADGEGAVLVETDGPLPTVTNRLAYLFVIPRTQEHASEIRVPVGTGPYRFVERRADGSVLARAVESWRPKPRVEMVRFMGIDDENERAKRFLTGEVDVAVAIPNEQLPEIRRHPGLRVIVQPGLSVRVLAVIPAAAAGATQEALADPRVRRALLLAIDRRHLTEVVLRGSATVASQYVHPVIFGYDPGITPVPHDPEEASRLMASAGFPGGFEADLGHGLIPEDIVASLVDDLARVGVRLHPVALPFPELLRRARAAQLPLVLYARSCMSGDASEFLDTTVHSVDGTRGLGGENYHGYANPRVDALLEAAAVTTDPEQRRALLQQAQRLALTDLPVLPLVVQWEYLGCRSGLEVVPRNDGWVWMAAFRVNR